MIDLMHPRNRYNVKPDFGELAKVHPALKPFLISKLKSSLTPEDTMSPQSGKSPNQLSHTPKSFPYTLDFSNPQALRELTRAVLAKDFSLEVDLPLDKLIPAVPQRLNYIHWVEDLLGLCEGVKGVKDVEASCEGVKGVETSCEGVKGVEASCKGVKDVETSCEGMKGVETSCEGMKQSYEGVEDACTRGEAVSSQVTGIDIGTGASCIYPLLGSRMNGWNFLATDIDEASVDIARGNVTRNGLADRIEVKVVSPEVVLSKVLDPTVPQYTFSMCNPPFFKDTDDRLGGVASCSGRRPQPKTFSSASTAESITEGGEVKFVSRIIEDSLGLKEKVRWYTAMLGKKASLRSLLTQLKQHEVPVVTTTEFVQGKTWRWGLAWSFDCSLKKKVAVLNTSNRKRKAIPLCLQLPLNSLFLSQTVDERLKLSRDWLLEQFKELRVKVCEESSESVRLSCVAQKNTWSHQRKRRRIIEQLERQKKELNEASLCGSESLSEDGKQTKMDEQEQKFKKIEGKALSELEALSTPCHMEFTCTIVSGCHDNNPSPKRRKSNDPLPQKKRKLSTDKAEETVGVFIEFEWVEGEDKDLLHQIIQYLSNKVRQFSS